MARTAKPFWHYVDQTGGPDACWPFLGHIGKRWGYGVYNGSNAHREAYILTHGDPGPEVIIRHTCNNRPCCNPGHLVPGNDYDNAQDRIAAGNNASGERNGTSKLTWSDVAFIRENYKPRHAAHGMTAFARRYGVTRRVIWLVVTNRMWEMKA